MLQDHLSLEKKNRTGRPSNTQKVRLDGIIQNQAPPISKNGLPISVSWCQNTVSLDGATRRELKSMVVDVQLSLGSCTHVITRALSPTNHAPSSSPVSRNKMHPQAEISLPTFQVYTSEMVQVR